jgi:hypothetical protein
MVIQTKDKENIRGNKVTRIASKNQEHERRITESFFSCGSRETMCLKGLLNIEKESGKRFTGYE